jgi:hypothetical protein
LGEIAARVGRTECPLSVVVSDMIRTNEFQVWFLAEHLVDEPLVLADGKPK